MTNLRAIRLTETVYATMLHSLGLDHQRLTFEHNGRNETLTDADLNHAKVVGELFAS